MKLSKLKLHRETLARLSPESIETIQIGLGSGTILGGTGGTVVGGTLVFNLSVSACVKVTCVACSDPCGTDFCSMWNSRPYCCA
jgi:hypothetical protein